MKNEDKLSKLKLIFKILHDIKKEEYNPIVKIEELIKPGKKILCIKDRLFLNICSVF